MAWKNKALQVKDAHALRTSPYQAFLEPVSPPAKIREAEVMVNNLQKGQTLYHTGHSAALGFIMTATVFCRGRTFGSLPPTKSKKIFLKSIC